jgi:4-hydroxy-4-methyl-2-oxoglutarate aldolase
MKNRPEINPEILNRLRAFDTPTICNLIELFEVRPQNTGFMDARIKACFPEMPPIVGMAATATFRSGGPPLAGGAYAGLEGQVERFQELNGTPVVVLQDLDDPPVGATFGEVMCSTYQAFGAAGLVTSGAARDLQQVRELGFPVFASGAICSHAYPQIIDVHVPVRVGGLTVYPGELLHGDLNGVTTIPAEIVAELVDVGDAFVAAEGIILETLRSDPLSVGRLREARAASQARIAELRQRVSRATH